MTTKLSRPHNVLGSGPVRYRLIGGKDAPTGLYLAVDYTNAPIPQHYYVADYVYLSNLDPQLLLVFGKKESSDSLEGKLRNKIEVFFPAPFFFTQLWKSSRDFHKSLRRFVEECGYEIPAISSKDVSAEKVQTFHSNNVFMAHGGGEALLDFFYMSPRDMYLKPRKSENIDLEALVRVIMAPNLLLSLLNACEPIAQELTRKYPSQEIDNEVMESD